MAGKHRNQSAAGRRRDIYEFNPADASVNYSSFSWDTSNSQIKPASASAALANGVMDRRSSVLAILKRLVVEKPERTYIQGMKVFC